MNYFFAGVFALGLLIFAGRKTVRRQLAPLPELGVNAETDRQVLLIAQHQLRTLGYVVAETGQLDAQTRAALLMFEPEGSDHWRLGRLDHAYDAATSR